MLDNWNEKNLARLKLRPCPKYRNLDNAICNFKNILKDIFFVRSTTRDLREFFSHNKYIPFYIPMVTGVIANQRIKS